MYPSACICVPERMHLCTRAHACTSRLMRPVLCVHAMESVRTLERRTHCLSPPTPRNIAPRYRNGAYSMPCNEHTRQERCITKHRNTHTANDKACRSSEHAPLIQRVVNCPSAHTKDSKETLYHPWQRRLATRSSAGRAARRSGKQQDPTHNPAAHMHLG